MVEAVEITSNYMPVADIPSPVIFRVVGDPADAFPEVTNLGWSSSFGEKLQGAIQFLFRSRQDAVNMIKKRLPDRSSYSPAYLNTVISRTKKKPPALPMVDMFAHAFMIDKGYFLEKDGAVPITDYLHVARQRMVGFLEEERRNYREDSRVPRSELVKWSNDDLWSRLALLRKEEGVILSVLRSRTSRR
jgi:hypothetical protein